MIFKVRIGGIFKDVTVYKIRSGGVWKTLGFGKHRSGTTQKTYWQRLLKRPPEGTYAGVSVLGVTPSTDAVPCRYRGATTPAGSYSMNYGFWSATDTTPIGGTTAEIYCTHLEGDMETQSSSAINTWLPLFPGSVGYRWAAENSVDPKRAIFKFDLRDQLGNVLTWWADCAYNDRTIISYTALTMGGGGGGGSGGGGGEWEGGGGGELP